jgi:hypothetical protein
MSGDVSHASLVPRDVYVGDEAELSFDVSYSPLSLSGGQTISVNPSSLRETADATILACTVAERDGRAAITIRFIPWVSGTLSLPDVSFGKTVVSPPPVSVATLLDDSTAALSPPRSPLLIPGTTFMLYGAGAGILTLALALALFVSRVRARAALSPRARGRSRRVRRFQRELSLLSRRSSRLSSAEWYRRLSSALRDYLGDYFGLGQTRERSCTGGDFSALCLSLRGVLSEGNVEEVRARVRALFSDADAARFGGMDLSPSFADDLTRARSLISLLEREADDDLP